MLLILAADYTVFSQGISYRYLIWIIVRAPPRKPILSIKILINISSFWKKKTQVDIPSGSPVHWDAFVLGM
jgi:hypothetical protein